MEAQSFDIQSVNESVYEFVKSGTVGQRVLDTLVTSDVVVQKEGWLWDFKKELPTNKESVAKAVRSIVGFHNTLGGYLIYGVHETEKDKGFSISGVDPSELNVAQLRTQLTNYTAQHIDITVGEAYARNKAKEKVILVVIHVPKRGDEAPVKFVKNGPEVSRKNLFRADQVYMRQLDECMPASTPEDWQLLYSPRSGESLLGIKNVGGTARKHLDHNLPDRQLICPKFIGRKEIISQLWRWLSDPFEYTRILAGDGGKGKTSIAYEFCFEFSIAAPANFERVLWFSAKEKQFSGIANEHYQLKPADFYDTESFLRSLCENLALKSEEYEDASIDYLKQQAKFALSIFPMLVVVDNVDSVEEDDQKRIVDACRQLGSNNTRFLVTTRKRFAYSSDLCIEVSGFPEEEFRRFLDSTCNRFGLHRITGKEITKLRTATDGSPLLTESILRLVRHGDSLHEAIKEWKGRAGEDARSAALRKEICGLSREAKRVLLAAVYFGACSATELRQSVDMEKLQFNDSLEELRSLFLIDDSRIIDNEARFAVSSTTSLLAESLKESLAFDHSKLRSKVTSLRNGINFQKKEGNRKHVGQAISQSLALLRDGDICGAIDTLDVELKRQKMHPDLLLAKGRCLLRKEPFSHEDARKTFSDSYENGQRKDLLFELWYELEEKINYPNGMIEVASKAIDADVSGVAEWRHRAAKAFVLRAIDRKKDQNNSISALEDLKTASWQLGQSISTSQGFWRKSRVDEAYALHDFTWKIAEETHDIGWLSVFDLLMDQVAQGDIRTVQLTRTVRCLEEAVHEKRGVLPEKYRDAISRRIGRIDEALKNRTDADKRDRDFNDLHQRLLELDRKVELILP